MVSSLRRLHDMTSRALTSTLGHGPPEANYQAAMRRLRKLFIMVSARHCSKRRYGPPSEDSHGNRDEPNTKSLEAPQAKATATIQATTKDGQQDVTRLVNRLTPQPLRGKQAGLYTTHTQCLECDSLVELGDVGYEDALCDNCVDEATERYWGPPHDGHCTKDDSNPEKPTR